MYINHNNHKILENTACIILNWKKPKKTAYCIKKIYQANSLPGTIYVVDNHSNDNSPEKILNTIEKKYKIPHNFLDNIIWIETFTNIGYAAGNNIAINEINKIEKFEFIWIINNDTEVEDNSLERMYLTASKNVETGFIGAPILYKNSNKVQCYGGGIYSQRLGISRLLYKHKNINTLPYPRHTPDYIMGCNMLVRKAVINNIGFMDESFFMYSEEIDWQIRAKKYGWKVLVSDNCIIYHNSAHDRHVRNISYYYYKNRASILCVRKHYGFFWASIAFIIHIPIILLDKPSIRGIFYAATGLLQGLIGTKDYRY